MLGVLQWLANCIPSNLGFLGEILEVRRLQSWGKARTQDSHNPTLFHIYLFTQCVKHVRLMGCDHRNFVLVSQSCSMGIVLSHL